MISRRFRNLEPLKRSWSHRQPTITYGLIIWSSEMKRLFLDIPYGSQDHILIVVTVGPNFRMWMLSFETNIMMEGKIFSTNADRFNIFYNTEDIDHARGQLPLDLYRKENEKFKDQELHFYLIGLCTELECYPIKIGGYDNHLHIVINLSKKITLAAFMEKIKGHSSKWIKTKGNVFQNFYWQGGYGAFSVRESDLPHLIEYLNNQHEHHKRFAFREEYISFLQEYKIDYDERYLWD